MINLKTLYAIDAFAPIPLTECIIKKPYLLNRAGIEATGSVLLLLLPYYTRAAEGGNVSMYAAAEDYHEYCAQLFADMIPRLQSNSPEAKFAGYADHAPILEVDAAAKAGLGVYGKNGLLLTDAYSSFVFIAGVYTDLPAAKWQNLVENVVIRTAYAPDKCHNCGACRDACPAHAIGGSAIDGERCMSAVTQKKKLTDTEMKAVADAEYVWGCDVCQLVCPYTKAAREAGTLETPLCYFRERLIKTLDRETLADLTGSGEFDRRAFSWRGEGIIDRNLRLRHGKEKEKEEEEEEEEGNEHNHTDSERTDT